ncbi:hypothetical protein VE04_06181 [Pseudogymnoascus sp. 24MN13]|nr:hypothetical protein VE04_06181 [Pseudogymnoascus sp. 24MN13]
MVDKMKVYVHGSYRNIDGQYPVAVSTAVFTHESGSHKAWTRIVPAHPTPTRQRADLMAIVLALEMAIVDDGRLYDKRAVDLNIYSGSLYAVKSLTDWADRWIYNGWIGTDGREVDNQDLIKRALQVEEMLMDGGSVRYTCIPREEKTEANTYGEHALNFAEDQKKYAIKNIFSTEFEYQLDLQAPLRGCPNLRVVIDTVPEHLLFVYHYCTTHLLKLAEKDSLSDASRKRILRDTLAGIANLHERNILHGDIKPDNIFVNYEESPNGTIEVQRVQVGDLEMGSVIPPGLNVRGAKLGNPMWRSPESHAAARINLPTDVFSFGLVCIYTTLRKIIFRIDSEGLSRADEERLVVKRLLFNFGDGPGLVGLIDHLDDSVASWRDLVLDVTPEFTTTNPRKPFSMWVEINEGFRDIVTKMTSLDPARRITAREALEHPWFQDL